MRFLCLPYSLRIIEDAHKEGGGTLGAFLFSKHSVGESVLFCYLFLACMYEVVGGIFDKSRLYSIAASLLKSHSISMAAPPSHNCLLGRAFQGGERAREQNDCRKPSSVLH